MKIGLYFAAIALLTAPSVKVIPGAREVEIVGVDYAFRLPSTLPPGLTTFRFRNDSQHGHEFNFYLLKQGVTIDEVIRAGKEGKSQMALIDGSVGVLFAGKGQTSMASLTTNLLPGRTYGVHCILRDSATGPRHYELGMYGAIQVGTGSAAPTPHVLGDSVIAVDYAFSRYPREITPGAHSFVFRNAGKQRHEFVVTLLKRGVTLDSVMAVDKNKGNVRPLFERRIGLLLARPGETGLGTLDMSFLPGRDYLVECDLQDDVKSPPHFALGMQGSIHVSGTPGT